MHNVFYSLECKLAFCITVLLSVVVMNHHFVFFLSLVISVVQAMRCFYVMIFELHFYILTKNVPAQVQFIYQLLVNIYVLLTNISVNNYFLMAVSV